MNLPHGELAVSSGLAAFGDLLGGLGSHGGGAVSHGHGLDTGTDTDVNQTGLDVGGNVDDGLETGRALTVGGVDRGLIGVSGVESSHAGDGGTTGSLENVSDADIVNDGGVDLGAVLDGSENSGQKILTEGVMKKEYKGSEDVSKDIPDQIKEENAVRGLLDESIGRSCLVPSVWLSGFDPIGRPLLRVLWYACSLCCLLKCGSV